MYLPDHFKEERAEVLHSLIQAHPLGTLVMQGPTGLEANHLPFELDASAGAAGVLRAHVARANALAQPDRDGAEVLVVFHGPQAYVSPNWYPSKHETHRQVPTWNYEVVHAHGRLRRMDDERFLRGLVARLTRHHESTEPRPWRMGDAPPDYIADLLTRIVGLEVVIERLMGKRKLSQNKGEGDIRGAIDGLRARHGTHDIATAMMGLLPADE